MSLPFGHVGSCVMKGLHKIWNSCKFKDDMRKKPSKKKT